MVRGPSQPKLSRLHPAALGALLFALLPFRAIADNASVDQESPVLSADEQALVAAVPVSSAPIRNRSNRFDVRFEIPSGLDWRQIYMKPRLITLSIDPVPDGSGREESIGDVEAIFPIEAKYLFQALVDYSSYPRVSPRTVFSADKSSLHGPFVYHKRVQKVSAQFLGFGQTYLFVTNNYETRLGPDEYGLKWNLEQSLDQKFYIMTGSWYVKGMSCDGEPCSYLRYYNHTGFNKKPPVPVSILGLVTGSSFKNLPGQFYREALRLKESGG